MKSSLLRPALCVLVAIISCTAARQATAQTIYDANSGANASGVFSSATGGPGQHYMQQVTMAGGAAAYSLTSMPVFGIRWNDITAGTQNLYLNFYSGGNLSGSATNALAGAVQFASLAFGLSAPGANGSYNYNLTFAPILTPGATFLVEVIMTNAAGTAYSNAIAYRFSTGGAPAVGSNPGFTWVDGNADGTFAGSEQSANQNIRMVINGTAVAAAVPETSPILLGGLVWMGLLLAARRFRGASRATVAA